MTSRYQASPKHCEPITAQKPGTKCPKFSVGMAQALLDDSIALGDKRYATAQGVAFVAQKTFPHDDVWHGYPEGWDYIDVTIKRYWLDLNKITRKDLKQWGSREAIKNAWREP